MNYMTLMSYVLSWAPRSSSSEASDQRWMHVLGEILNDVSPVQHQILSTLTLLSNSLLSGQSLPPYLPLPKPYEMTRRLLSLPRNQEGQPRSSSSSSSSASTRSSSSCENAGQGNSSSAAENHAPRQGTQENHNPEAWDLLDARNMEEQGYTEFAVLQVCSTLIIGDLEGLIKTVGDLVGTVDFSFRVEHDDSSTSDLGSVHRLGTWASRASGAGGEAGKGKKD